MESPASRDSLERDRAVWATDPERIDPDDYPARSPFARLITWAPCTGCDLQVHVLYDLFLLQGITCPVCGARLMSPPADAPERLSLVLRQEDDFSRRIEANAE